MIFIRGCFWDEWLRKGRDGKGKWRGGRGEEEGERKEGRGGEGRKERKGRSEGACELCGSPTGALTTPWGNSESEMTFQLLWVGTLV